MGQQALRRASPGALVSLLTDLIAALIAELAVVGNRCWAWDSFYNIRIWNWLYTVEKITNKISYEQTWVSMQ